MRVRRRHPISSKEIRSIRDSLKDFLSEPQIDALFSGLIERAAFKNYDIIASNKEPVLFNPDGDIFPTLRGFLRIAIERRYLQVDSGAVPFVANGADVMSPGVVAIDPALAKGDLCVVTDERHNKPIGVARMMVNASEVDRRKKGKIAKNIHHVGDALWKVDMS